jgi:hypothetical protein
MNRGYDWRLGKVRSIAIDGKVIYDTALSKFRLSDAFEHTYDPFLNTIGTLLNSFDWTGKFPSDLLLTIDSDEDITLNWTNNGVADYDTISVDRSTDGTNYTEIESLPIGSTIYAGSITLSTYYWRIRYKSGVTYSDASNVVTVTEASILSAIGARVTETGEIRVTELGYIRVTETV